MRQVTIKEDDKQWKFLIENTETYSTQDEMWQAFKDQSGSERSVFFLKQRFNLTLSERIPWTPQFDEETKKRLCEKYNLRYQEDRFVDLCTGPKRQRSLPIGREPVRKARRSRRSIPNVVASEEEQQMDPIDASPRPVSPMSVTPPEFVQEEQPELEMEQEIQNHVELQTEADPPVQAQALVAFLEQFKESNAMLVEQLKEANREMLRKFVADSRLAQQNVGNEDPFKTNIFKFLDGFDALLHNIRNPVLFERLKEVKEKFAATGISDAIWERMADVALKLLD